VGGGVDAQAPRVQARTGADGEAFHFIVVVADEHERGATFVLMLVELEPHGQQW
jgi:hypothetical protein